MPAAPTTHLNGSDGSNITLAPAKFDEEGRRTDQAPPLDEHGTYKAIITTVILDSPMKGLTFSQLIEAMEARWEFYTKVLAWEAKNWKQAVYRDLSESPFEFELDAGDSPINGYEGVWRVRENIAVLPLDPNEEQ
ncbi:hypothetical protein BDY24DRAFT_440983 [Mrakia frigida]|uniref:uncharacterized protein n=1 Tax=Mrakia frigida TaxID=29902 RepID=UPI003FCBF6D9